MVSYIKIYSTKWYLFVNDFELIGTGLANNKKNDINKYINKTIDFIVDEQLISKGKIESSFGSKGKFKCVFENKISMNGILKLNYKINMFDKKRTWYQ